MPKTTSRHSRRSLPAAISNPPVPASIRTRAIRGDRPRSSFSESLADDDFETDALALPEDEIDDVSRRRTARSSTPAGRPDRRSGAHLPDADGRDSHAQPPGRDVRGQADRSQPPRIPLHACWPATIILQAAIGLLESIRDNKLRLDRTIEVSVINLREKARLLKVLTPNLRTLHHLMLQNKRDFALAINRRQPTKHRRQAWRRLLNRRVKAVRLVEEMGLRTQALAAVLAEAPADFAADGRDSPATGGAVPRRRRSGPRRRTSQGTLLPDADRAGEPGHASPPACADRPAWPGNTKPPNASSRPATCGWWSRSPSAIAIAA